MGLLIQRIRTSEANGRGLYSGSGASWTLASGPQSIALWTGATLPSDISAAALVFPVGIDPDATVVSAKLRLTPTAAATLTGKSVVVALLPAYDESISLGTLSLSPLASVSVALGTWAAGEVVEIDLGSLITTLLAQSGYASSRNATLLVSTDAVLADGASIAAFDLDTWQAPQLAIDFTWVDTETDPYTQVVRGLWDLLEASPHFAALVKVGNRIKFTETAKRDPMKAELGTQDVPEVRIVCVASEPHLHRTSNSSTDKVQFQIQVASGDKRMHVAHFPVKWAVYRALKNWIPYMMSLRWNGEQFVKLVAPVSVQEGTEKPELNRGIIGWSAVWACDAELWFRTLDL